MNAARAVFVNRAREPDPKAKPKPAAPTNLLFAGKSHHVYVDLWLTKERKRNTIY